MISGARYSGVPHIVHLKSYFVSTFVKANGGDSDVRLIVNSLGKAEVCEANMAAMVNQHVFRLQVTENDIEIVQIFKREDGLCSKELRLQGDREQSTGASTTARTIDTNLLCSEPSSLLLLDVREHLTTVNKLQNKVQAPCVLEIVEERNDEWVFGAEQDVLLIECVLHLASTHSISYNVSLLDREAE